MPSTITSLAITSQVMSTADIHLVMLNPKLEGLIVPSKIYAIAAAGRPENRPSLF